MAKGRLGGIGRVADSFFITVTDQKRQDGYGKQPHDHKHHQELNERHTAMGMDGCKVHGSLLEKDVVIRDVVAGSVWAAGIRRTNEPLAIRVVGAR